MALRVWEKPMGPCVLALVSIIAKWDVEMKETQWLYISKGQVTNVSSLRYVGIENVEQPAKDANHEKQLL